MKFKEKKLNELIYVLYVYIVQEKLVMSQMEGKSSRFSVFPILYNCKLLIPFNVNGIVIEI